MIDYLFPHQIGLEDASITNLFLDWLETGDDDFLTDALCESGYRDKFHPDIPSILD